MSSSISFEEAKKIIGEDIKGIYLNDEDEKDFNWITRLIYGSGECGCGDNIQLINKVLREWKINPPKKEILDDLFANINQLNERIDFKSIDITLLSFIGRMLSDESPFKGYPKRRSKHDVDDEKIFELLKLLIYFGLDFSQEEQKKIIIMISKKIVGLGKFISLFEDAPLERKRKRIKSEDIDS